MASTFSSNLRLEKIGTGEQTGSWGVTTNGALELIEDAITGFVSVVQGDTADKVLTANNGLNDEARNAVVKLTGALTAARNVVIPSAPKLYVIHNATTGGFAINVKTATGTAVAVSNAQIAWIYCDGTNCYAVGAVSGIPTGTVAYFAGATPPSGWFECNFAAVSRTGFAELFAAIGITYGPGNGTTTFNLPELRGEFIRVLDSGRGIDTGRALGSAQAGRNHAHVHTASAAASTHAHTGATADSGGNHAHTGTTNTTGAHVHSANWFSFNGNDVGGGATTPRSVTSANTSSAGDHAHTVTIPNSGAHTHTVTIPDGGSHTHVLTIDSEGISDGRPRNVALLACIKY